MTDDRSVAPRDLPSRIVVGSNGAYWRDYGTHYSMCPVSEDNDPVEPVAVYVNASKLADCEDALTTVERAYERDAGLDRLRAAWPEGTDERRSIEWVAGALASADQPDARSWREASRRLHADGDDEPYTDAPILTALAQDVEQARTLTAAFVFGVVSGKLDGDYDPEDFDQEYGPNLRKHLDALVAAAGAFTAATLANTGSDSDGR